MSDKQKEDDRRVVHLRVSADDRIVEQVATRIGELLVSEGYEVIEQSPAYPSRYGTNEGRVFLIVR